MKRKSQKRRGRLLGYNATEQAQERGAGAERLVANFPLLKLCQLGRDLPIQRLRDVLRDDVDELISKMGTVQFVLAQAGAPLMWMPLDAAPTFWKSGDAWVYFNTITFHGQKPDYSTAMNYLLYPSFWEPWGAPVVLMEGIYWPASVRGAAQS